MATIQVAEFWLGSADDEHGTYSHGDIIAKGLALKAYMHSNEQPTPSISGTVTWAETEASALLSHELYDEPDLPFPAKIIDHSNKEHKCSVQFTGSSEFNIESYEGPLT